MLIYPDTNIWNRLWKQDEDPAKVLQALSAMGATLVLSSHTIYELARTFSGSKPNSKEQAVKLFSYIKEFLDAGIPCSKQVMELVGGRSCRLRSRTNQYQSADE
jgi:predicted nucleic acid-binding protein